MTTYIVTRETTDITTEYSDLGRVGDPWPSLRPLTVMHRHYGENVTLEISMHYPNGVVPVEDLQTGATFRVTVERIEGGQP